MIAIEIVTPHGIAFQGEGDEISIPTTEGFIGVRRGHRALITTLKKGFLTVRKDNDTNQKFQIAGGFAEVMPDKVSIITRKAELT